MKILLPSALLVLLFAACNKDDNKINDSQKVGDYFEVPNWERKTLLGNRNDNGKDTILALIAPEAMGSKSVIYFKKKQYWVRAYHIKEGVAPGQKTYNAHIYDLLDFTDTTEPVIIPGEAVVSPAKYLSNSGTLEQQPQSIRADFPPFNTNVPGGFYTTGE